MPLQDAKLQQIQDIALRAAQLREARSFQRVATPDADPAFSSRVQKYWERLFEDETLPLPRAGFGQPEAFSMTWESLDAYAVLEFVEDRIEFYVDSQDTVVDESYATFDDFLNSEAKKELRQF